MFLFVKFELYLKSILVARSSLKSLYFIMSLKPFSEQVYIESLFYHKLWRYINKNNASLASISLRIDLSALFFHVAFTFKILTSGLIQQFRSVVCMVKVSFVH